MRMVSGEAMRAAPDIGWARCHGTDTALYPSTPPHVRAICDSAKAPSRGEVGRGPGLVTPGMSVHLEMKNLPPTGRQVLFFA